jgi:hypothetical protein
MTSSIQAAYGSQSVARVKHAALSQLAPHQPNETRLHQATLVMALLRPRIGKEQQHAIERGIGQRALQHIDCIGAEHANVAQLLLLRQRQQLADSGTVHLDTDETGVRFARGQFDQCLAHAGIRSPA